MLVEIIMKSSKVSRITISAAIVAIIGMLTYSWAVSPQASYVHAAQQYETVSLEVEKKANLITKLIRIKKGKIEELQAEIESTSISFFTSEQSEEFFGQLEKISTTANCDLKSVVFEKEKVISIDDKDLEVAEITEKKANIKIEAPYTAVIDLTETLKKYPHTICISNLEMKFISPDTNKLSCSMSLIVYLTGDKELLSDE